MNNFLVTHAVENIWCAPGQDRQFNFLLNRLSPARGYRDTFKLEWTIVDLPTKLGTYHVFNIGHINPRLLGLLPSVREWTRADFIVNREGINFVMMNDKGTVFPRHRCYYQLTRNNNLLFAIEEVPWMSPEIESERMYFHCYTNAIKFGDRNVFGNVIKIKSDTVRTRADILKFQEDAAKPVQYGKRFRFVNGKYVNELTLANIVVGDDVEYLDDHSVRETVTFNVPKIPRFDSTLDKLMKFLITYPNSVKHIDYHDDIELFVYVKDSNERWKGYYLHRNDHRTLRNLTHADYSLSVQAVTNLLQSNGDKFEQAYVEVNIRNAGLVRAVFPNQSRIHDLYRLSYAKRVKAMVGKDALVPVWRAATLEAAAYPELMRWKDMQPPQNRVEEHYGSYTSGMLMANSPRAVGNITGAPGVVLSYILGNRSTVFEYDAQGKYLGMHLHDSGERYFTRDVKARKLEVAKGYGGLQTSDVYNTAVTPLKPGFNYRCYRRSKGNGILPAGKWSDVTGSDQYIVTDDAIRWAPDDRTDTLVRFNDTFLVYENTINQYKGNFHFTIMEQIFRDEMQITQAMDLPRGDLDILLNGYSLVEGIDYIINFPEVIIISKKFLKRPIRTAKQVVQVRYRDFCDKDCQPRRRAEVGFVSHGLISHDKVIQLRRDRVNRVSVDGALLLQSEYAFPDEKAGTQGLNPINGKPFAIRDEVIPLNEVMDVDTYAMLEVSRDIDKSVSDYLTLHLPEKKLVGPNVIDGLYQLYSPFINAIYNDLSRGVLKPPYIDTHYSDEQIRQTLIPYEFLLPFDPSQHDSYVSRTYADVHPHTYDEVIDIPIRQYEFIARACVIYTGSRVVPNHYFSVSKLPEV